MNFFKSLFKSANAGFLAICLGFLSFFTAGLANAGLAADVQASIAGAGTEALTVGGYIVAAVATLIVVGMVLSLMRKAS